MKKAESSQTIRTQKGIHPFIHSFFYLKFKMKQTALCLFLLVCLLGTTVDAHRRGIGLGTWLTLLWRLPLRASFPEIFPILLERDGNTDNIG
ncbi:hypothetical protein KUTeg_009322 [Tegillarca granosa]|uniref:Uncharacterized protein n=1 Tax=Tegillarca granosa TaxID=220873 RepID=A0ABQ9F935_TEGGR|nr:hypothetical protein KUTeg_009322 [Tegillarca granosa]